MVEGLYAAAFVVVVLFWWWVDSVNRRLATIKAQILNTEGTLMAEAEAVYFIFNEQEAKEKFYYPGIEAFYEE